jgi:hypothetical protein
MAMRKNEAGVDEKVMEIKEQKGSRNEQRHRKTKNDEK